jgi:hypothetical protein
MMATTNLMAEIKEALSGRDGKWNEKKGVWDFSTVIAERKAFLSKKKLTYTFKIKIDDGAKIVKFSEMLIESGSGVSSGGGFDDDSSTGFGFKTESYNTSKGSRQGTIEEQSKLFGKDYSYTFDYSELRLKVKEIVEKAGYKFETQILPVK